MSDLYHNYHELAAGKRIEHAIAADADPSDIVRTGQFFGTVRHRICLKSVYRASDAVLNRSLASRKFFASALFYH